MTGFEWNSAIEIGHAEIDEQHRQLLILCSAVIGPLINSAEPKPGAAQLQALIEFTEEHFAFEEGLMRSAGYPEAERHAKYHASLLTDLKTFHFKVVRAQNANPVGLMNYLGRWLNLHIDAADRELVVWLRTHDSRQ